ncbi:hypothetical protein AX16_009679 [Volvariella volvacea WC 439]|nr:hypothetical protein AX16_009679 [Volvariella volvacea WC 439]
MKPREYCCCAIPLVNAGIYATLIEQLTLAVVVGVLSVATPSIVGAATPPVAPWILVVLCFVTAGVQVLGFLGVAQERTIMFRRYVTLHSLLSLATFAVAGAWIGISAGRHQDAKSRCLEDFFPSTPDQGPNEGETLCEIFPWVDIGIMGGIWLILAIMQTYLYFMLSSYGSSQRRDHAKYAQLGDPVHADAIPMDTRDEWDSRPSTDSPTKQDSHYRHVRQESGLSVSDVMSQPAQRPKDTFDYNFQDHYGRNHYDDDEFRPSGTYPPPGSSQAPNLNEEYYNQPYQAGVGRKPSRAGGY